MLRWPVQELHGIPPDVGREVRVPKRHREVTEADRRGGPTGTK